jgi:hypothetical protein
LDHQTGIITEPAQDGSYWLNSDNGPANAYIVIDLGGVPTRFFRPLQYAQRLFKIGTGAFSIGPQVHRSGRSGSDLIGFVTLVLA